MNLYAITACYGTDRDTALILAADDAAAQALASRGHDPRGLGTTGSEVWLVVRDCTLVAELPATPVQLSWAAPGPPKTIAELAAEPSAAELLRNATGP